MRTHQCLSRSLANAMLACMVAGCALVDVPTSPQGATGDDAFGLTRDVGASFQTDSLLYRLRAGQVGYEVEIGFTFTNHSPATAYFQNCRGGTDVVLQKQVNGEWKDAWYPVLLACLSQPIVVQPTERRHDSIMVFGGYPGCSCQPTFMLSDLTGVYRFVWGAVYNSYDNQTFAYRSLMPFGMRTSNAFVLAAQPR